MRTLSLTILLVLGLAACGGSGTDLAAQTGGDSTAFTSTEFNDTELLARMMRAPSATEYAGRRTVSSFVYDKRGVVDELTYSEKVISDGADHFMVAIEDVLAPTMDSARAEIFKLIQSGRGEFFYNHRDFRIRDINLLLENYKIIQGPGNHLVEGRECMSLQFHRRLEHGTSYELFVDLATSLVVSQREFDAEGRLASTVDLTELVVGPLDAESKSLLISQPRASWRPVRSSHRLDALNVHAPTLPPTGFQLIDQRIVPDPLGGQWYELIYGDGVEQIFMLFAISKTPTKRVRSENEVILYRHGCWTVVDGQLNGESVIVLGKASRDDLILMLESCL